jgi:hypothetical protein
VDDGGDDEGVCEGFEEEWRGGGLGINTGELGGERRVQDSNLCLPCGRMVFETIAIDHSANPPECSWVESNHHRRFRKPVFYPLNYRSLPVYFSKLRVECV